ncbi:homoserine kinase [Sphingomonas lacunae]|uniref:Homoserine kinase n=1 Tax=Sphingomonas lacunae TaxID=2698828 RepID=A0A6M4AW61_9SPHN|nr:homoserine kinase [Sphingomonas lacunae]QJQ33324.1 homoserine kinase [Sphingomonas lacunae]
MAVYTQVGAEDMATFLDLYGVGPLISAKGIAEGVENSNYLVDSQGGRFILTLYEKRVDQRDLPFFISLIDHLADKGNPVPRILPDLSGQHVQTLCGKPACLIQFLNGISVSRPTSRQAFAAGQALARMHSAAADFSGGPPNPLTLNGWRQLADRLGSRLDSISPGLTDEVADELGYLSANWPDHLPQSVIHADLFPDNVLMTGENVSGIIDFYFACRDITAYDFAVTHGAWCFSNDGSTYLPALAAAMAKGYQDVRPFSIAEQQALPVLARGAALRFMLTRSLDWLETPADALVARKDPLAYRRRLSFFRTATSDSILGR